MLKKILTITLIATSITNLNLYSQGTGTQTEPIPEEGVPIELLAPLPKKAIPHEATETIDPKILYPDFPESDDEGEESYNYRSQVISEEKIQGTTTKTRFFNKSYTMEDLSELLGEANKVDIRDKRGAEKKLSNLQEKHNRLEIFLKSLVTNPTTKFPPVYGIKDVGGIVKEVQSIKQKDPLKVEKIDLIKLRINTAQGILKTLQRTIDLKRVQLNQKEKPNLVNLEVLGQQKAASHALDDNPMQLLKPTPIKAEPDQGKSADFEMAQEEGIPIKLLAPFSDRNKALYKPEAYRDGKTIAEMHEQLKAPEKMALMSPQNYTMPMLGDILSEVSKMDFEDPSNQSRLKVIRNTLNQLRIFLEKANAKIVAQDFRPIKVYGISDVANISNNLSEIDPDTPKAFLELEIEFVRYKITTLDNFLNELKKLLDRQ